MRLLKEVAERLASQNIAYTLIGAGALAVHGVSRSTADLDLLTVDCRALLRETWSDFEARGRVRRLLKGDADDPLAGSVRLVDHDEIVDVVVGRYAWQREIIDRSPLRDLGETSLPVVAPAGLILLKLHAGGPKDAWDVRSVLEVAADPQALVAEVEAAVSQLPSDARELWARLRHAG